MFRGPARFPVMLPYFIVRTYCHLNPDAFCFIFSLLILTFLNLGLFLKLWAMEDVAHRMYLSSKQRLRERSEARSVTLLLQLCVLVWIFPPLYVKQQLHQ